MSDSAKLLKIFATPLVVDALDGAPRLNAELEAAIMAKMAADSGVRKSNVGGWHSNTDLISWAGEAGKAVARRAVALAKEHTAVASDAGSLKWMISAWANVSSSGHSNRAHAHGGCFWSAVYYVRVGKAAGGRLVFTDPRMPALSMYEPSLTFKNAGPEGVMCLRPTAGQLVLFPSWLQHYVEPWDGEDARISIAMNLSTAAQLGAGATASETQEIPSILEDKNNG